MNNGFMNLPPKQVFELTMAAADFLKKNNPYEQPIDHSPHDLILELERARLELEQSRAMKGRFILQVCRPINEFAHTAHWLYSVSYLNTSEPDGLSVAYVSLRKEMPPFSPMGFACAESEVFECLLSDLSYR